ncbi:hypothetical protein HY285_04800 [Candidatus Peregrinibacteria bacterium]|nr:hypothetical protein [Candidatus Peregrinibacteria bacterium]MBI3816830.1 hypothetical protein [Candidatus Peregrinibacteria bacterium]
MTITNAERGLSQISSVETSRLIVSQPAKLTELNDLLLSLENLDRRVSERTAEDRSADLGGAGAGTTGQQGTSGASARDQAIANIPAEAVIKKKLEQHITGEIKSLRALARRASRTSRPGGAHSLNQIYARIRRLNALLAEILEASLDLLRRLFIRVFIDHQPIL